jgi:hypothetical protein
MWLMQQGEITWLDLKGDRLTNWSILKDGKQAKQEGKLI